MTTINLLSFKMIMYFIFFPQPWLFCKIKLIPSVIGRYTFFCQIVQDELNSNSKSYHILYYTIIMIRENMLIPFFCFHLLPVFVVFFSLKIIIKKKVQLCNRKIVIHRLFSNKGNENPVLTTRVLIE